MSRNIHPRDIAPERQSRVRARLKDGSGHYPVGAVEALEGAVGRPVRYNPKSFRGRPAPGPAYLVRLEKPVKAWWEGAGGEEQVEEFWFAKQDLRLLTRRT